MKTLPLALAVLLASSYAAADYSPPALPDLVLASDAIVVGEIEALSSGTFRLRVSEVVAGPISTPTIEVQRFEDWTCSARWAPYAVGQRALLFLNARPEGGWQIRSAGGEGEMPIVGANVHVNSYYNELSAGAAAMSRMTVHGGAFYGFTLDQAAFVAALRRARSCFAADLEGRYRRVSGVRVTCSDAQRSALGQSPVGARLLRSLAVAAATPDPHRRP